jgi:hypothetical protein
MKKLLSLILIVTLLSALTIIIPAQADEKSETPDKVISVIIPTTVDFTLDPLELAGRGQIYSESFVIENLGENSVLLTLSDIRVTFANDTDFEAVPLPFGEDFQTERKVLYLALDFGRDDISPIILTDTEHPANVRIPLFDADTEFSTAALSFSGNINSPAELDWLPGDVHIAMTYTLRIAPPPVNMNVTLEASDDLPLESDEPTEEASEEAITEPTSEPSEPPTSIDEPIATSEPIIETTPEPTIEPEYVTNTEPETEMIIERNTESSVPEPTGQEPLYEPPPQNNIPLPVENSEPEPTE